MLFDISDLDPRGEALDAAVEIPPFPWEGGEVVSCDPARFVGRLTPTRRGIELTGTYSTVVHQMCSRCLTTFARPLEERVLQDLSAEVAQAGPGAWRKGAGRWGKYGIMKVAGGRVRKSISMNN